ncbi:MAG: hypothetical protein PUA56_02770 [Bacillales bacterium]|nr:hypothetical protein [Bacillales bacterium]
MSNTFALKLNGQTIECNKKTKLLDLINPEERTNYIIAKVNNRLRELTYEVYYDAEIELLTQCDYQAIKCYETSLRYIVAMACDRIFPNLNIKYSYNISRSIYLTNKDDIKFTKDHLKKLINEIDQIIKNDYPLVKKIYTNEEAKRFYEEKGLFDKIDILRYRPEKTVHFYECDGYLNYMYGQMVPSTGHIKSYNLKLYSNGILIQYPRSETKGKIPLFKDAPVFSKTLKDSYIWARTVSTEYVASINKYAEIDGPIDFINMCEQHHNNMLSELGNMIYNDKENLRLICIAGPSSSGKTTFANRLRVELMSLGLKPVRISLDDYYKEKKDIPLGEDGTPDLECLEALDIDLINQNLFDLIEGDEVTLPKFDFKLGKRVEGRTLHINENQPLIIEGIHALNDQLTSSIARHQKFKIFIAPQAQINIDNQNPISLTDLRLVRRIVRDYQFRGSSAEETIAMWPNVRKGEFRWIYDTQENADYVFNSLLPYELCIMRRYALPLLTKIPDDSPYYIMANRLIKFLKLFINMEDNWVPCNSIMREFIGGSCFQDV